MITREFNLYLHAGHSIPLVINVNQYDRGEQWLFTLFNADGTQYIPSSGAIVGIKSDNLGIINSGTVDSQGRVVINETQQMTAAVGKAAFELLIDDQTHGTANFIVLVEPKPGDNADLSESDYSLFQQAIDGTSATAIAQGVADWMDENLTPTSPVVDTSLTVSGAAADSAKVGQEISDLKSQIDQIGGGGQPIPVTLASEMTDTEQIYVYLGEEEEYDYGYIYVYLNDAWTKTGLYGRGKNGEDGADGFSPTASVTSTSTGATISITDKNGTTTATLTNGTATQEQVNAWLNDHPEATTTVEDGAVTTAKLADGAVTQAKLDPNLELGVADNSVTTPKIVDHAVTMDKTDFHYTRSLKYNPSWLKFTGGSGVTPSISITHANLATAVSEFPDILSGVITGVKNYWQSNTNARFTTRQSGSAKTIAVTKSYKTLTVNGVTYGIQYITKENFLSAYQTYLTDINNGRTGEGFSLGLTTSGNLYDGNMPFAVDDNVTTNMIEMNFSETVISEDFVTAVHRAIESEGGIVSDDEEKAKNKLSGKVMICLGDSFTVGMGGLLSAIATKYEMVIDNRGVVSSTICGSPTSNGTKGYYPMWERANTIVSDYASGHTIDETSYTASDVGIITFMGGANDGFGVETWIGTGIHETNKETIYGACNHIFNVLQENFPNAKLICITQPSVYNRLKSSVSDDASAQTLGFENLAELQAMTDVQFSNYAMAQKEKAVKDTAWSFSVPVVDMFANFPTVFNPSNRTTYWNNDKLHLTTAGYTLISKALDKKIVEVVVG